MAAAAGWSLRGWRVRNLGLQDWEDPSAPVPRWSCSRHLQVQVRPGGGAAAGRGRSLAAGESDSVRADPLHPRGPGDGGGLGPPAGSVSPPAAVGESSGLSAQHRGMSFADQEPCWEGA